MGLEERGRWERLRRRRGSCPQLRSLGRVRRVRVRSMLALELVTDFYH